MKQKILTIIFGTILLIGIVTAGVISADYIGEIINPSGINISDFTAGTATIAEFSFDYLDNYDADKHYPLIFKINISYIEDSGGCQLDDCSVGKDNFGIEGFVRRYRFGFLYKDIKLNCSEESPLTINHQMGSNTLDVPDGTFYCYNITEGTIDDLKKRNKVFLDIFSNPALYPATYNITAQMFYANDTKAPIVNIINKDIFENNYFKKGKDIEIIATINDNTKIKDFPFGKIFTDTENISVPYYTESDGIYYFLRNLPDISEGNWEMKVFAEDTEGNRGNDSTTLRIDRTPPEIVLVEPIGGIYSEIIPIKFNVIDEKAGVDNESVQARLREIKEGIGLCPETGGPVNGTGCITTPWINLTLVDDLFEVNVNTTYYNLTSGEYWLDAIASDVLGNKVEWIA